MANEFIEVRWEVEDGYAGKTRPQYTKIRIADIMDCWSEDEVKSLIDDCIQADFEHRISAGFTRTL